MNLRDEIMKRSDVLVSGEFGIKDTFKFFDELDEGAIEVVRLLEYDGQYSIELAWIKDYDKNNPLHSYGDEVYTWDIDELTLEELNDICWYMHEENIPLTHHEFMYWLNNLNREELKNLGFIEWTWHSESILTDNSYGHTLYQDDNYLFILPTSIMPINTLKMCEIDADFSTYLNSIGSLEWAENYLQHSISIYPQRNLYELIDEIWDIIGGEN